MMTEKERNELIEKINTYWKCRPKADESGEKKTLFPIHDFDNMSFTDEAHVRLVREYYDRRAGREKERE